MNRTFTDYNSSVIGARNSTSTPHQQLHNHNHHRRAHSFNAAVSKHPDHDNLDLFSRSRPILSLTPSDHSLVSMKLGKISVGSVKLPARNALDDLLASTDGGKHDYDWLLTPPESPLCASSERSELQPSFVTPRSASRSTLTTKPSRLSTGQLDSGHSSKPARSSSVTRSSVSLTLNSTYSSNRSNSLLNTSSASVSSYIRPSSPIARSSTSSRPSAPTRTTHSRSSTPSRPRSASTISSGDKPRQSQNSRPSTPTSSRSQIPANPNFPVTRSNSRPSTPTRRSPSSNSAAPSLSVSTGRVVSNGRSQTSTSRPSSPSPRILSQQSVIPSDFQHDTPPNLRTTLPDRPVSAGRSRPGGSMASRINTETLSSVNMLRRPSSPTVSRGRSVEPHGRGHLHFNGRNADMTEPSRSAVSDSMRLPAKALATVENGGIGRTISKKLLDMAIRNMDIRNGSGSLRPLPSSSLFPQSIRSSPSRNHAVHGSGSPTSVNSKSPSLSSNGSIVENGSFASRLHENGKKEEIGRMFGRLTAADMYESTRYDAILLKEDLKNTTWLHSVDDMSDQCSIFENGFEPLPEPFGLS
ncbi:uncharacterized protein LOC130813364 [Amaranthus tricolor]|uniref:uncharacterized protein LOC130813364 n=1 Tax=Amaranthus tricolor TaxID=29722 RepID=UPI00258E8AAA|nr:uncharacterized protein LOC130813364 [Amaranthus tricolor]